MAEFNAEVCFTRLEQNVKSNQYRIDDIEGKVNDFQEIIICIREIAIEMRGLKEAQDEIKRNLEKSQDEFKKSQECLTQQLREVEKIPDKKASSYIDKMINAVIAAVVAYVMAKILIE